MSWISDFVAGAGNIPLLADVLLKSTAVLVLVGIASLALRRASAAVRHLAWSLALGSLLVLPLLSVSVPVRWHILPPMDVPAVVPSAAPRQSASADEARPDQVIASATPAGSSLPDPGNGAPADTPLVRVTPSLLFVAIWALGAAFVLGRYVFGMVVIGRVVRYSRRLDADWEPILERAIVQLGVTSDFDIRRSDAVAMPFAYGILTPTIVLPAASDTWSRERREAVILHELAHVNRGDLLMNMLANVACAAYWFHPLVWMAAHRLRVEGERASDDSVITTGARPSDYAEHLLHIVHSVRDAVPAGALAMARRSDFEGRLLAILEPSISRTRVSRLRTAAIAGAFVLGVVPLAAMAPVAPQAATVAQSTPEWMDTAAADDVDMPQAAPARPASAPPAGPGEQSRPAQSQVSGALAALIGTLDDGNAGVRLAAVKSLGALDDPRAIAALSKALREDTDARVRETAAWALGEIDDVRAAPELIAALRTERAANVRAKIVWALGEIDDPSAISAIAAVVKDANVEVRRQAAWALGEIDDPSAVPALLSMVRDSDTEVRKHVATALGELEDPAAIEPLTILAKDGDPEVRHHAVSALGQFEDERTLPTLIVALKDSDAEVRQHAASAIGDIDDLRTAPRALIDALADPDREMRKQVIHALSAIEDVAAVPALKRVTSDPDTEVRRAAVEALSEIGGAEAIESLMALLKDPDPEIRRIVAEALGNRRR